MNLERVYRWGRQLPKPLRTLVRRLTDSYFEFRGYPLGGVLEGCRMRGSTPLGAYLDGSYEPKVSETIVRVVQPRWVCVDVGAHIGYFTLLLAKLVGENGRVIAFEAHADNAEQVSSNVRMNGYGAWVRVENMAVSDGAHKWVKLLPGPDGSSFVWSIVAQHAQGYPPHLRLKVPATSLDAYFPPGFPVDFVKMDIEGAEIKALRGMRRILHQCMPLVLVELHRDVCRAAIQELRAAHYELYDIAQARWLDDPVDTPTPHHCLAAPRARRADIPL